MSHDHAHHHHDHTQVANIKVAFFLNLSFTVIEAIGGILTNSMAILSDALHDLGDSLSLGFAWYFQKKSQKGRDAKYSYGYKRFSLMGAIINSMILLAGSVIILREAIPRILNPQDIHAGGMILLAVLGILVNGAAVLRLKKGNSVNEKVVSLHMLEDVLGWVAVLLGGIVMYFVDLPIIDPIMSVLIALFVLFNVVRNIKEIISILFQSVPDSAHEEKIEAYLKDKKGIQSFHDLHIWSMDGEYHVLTVHLVLEKGFFGEKADMLKWEIRKELSSMNIAHATLEMEYSCADCEYKDC